MSPADSAVCRVIADNFERLKSSVAAGTMVSAIRDISREMGRLTQPERDSLAVLFVYLTSPYYQIVGDEADKVL